MLGSWRPGWASSPKAMKPVFSSGFSFGYQKKSSPPAVVMGGIRACEPSSSLITSAIILVTSGVIVAVTPYDAAKLTASAQMGILQLMLRPIGADGDTNSVAYYVIPLPKENNAPQTESAQPAPSAPVQTSNGGQAASAPARVSVDNNFGVEVIRGT